MTMRITIANCLKDSVRQSEAADVDILFAMDFDLGIIDADEELVEYVRKDVFLDRVIASCDDETLLRVRDFFLTDF